MEIIKGGRPLGAVSLAVRTTMRMRTRVSLIRTRITLRRTRTRTTARVSAKSENLCFKESQRVCVVPGLIVATAYTLGKGDSSRREVRASATAAAGLESRNNSGRGLSWVSSLHGQVEHAMAAKTKNYLPCQGDSEI